MDEQQARDQYTRRALCLQEALVLFKTAAESRELGTGEEAADRLFKGFESYTAATRKPPNPPKLAPVDRTAKQRSEYFAELISQLDQDRKKALNESLIDDFRMEREVLFEGRGRLHEADAEN